MTRYDALWLDNQLCFALYTATNAITRVYRTVLAPLGLTYPQYLVIVKLLEKPSMTSGELARALRLDAGTLTPMLKRLAAAGLIERTRRIEDERVIDNQLTVAGLALRDDLLAAQQGVVCRTGLDEAQAAALHQALHALTDTLTTMPDALVEDVPETV